MDPGPPNNSSSNVGDSNGAMSAGCSKFPSYNGTSNQNGIFVMDQTSPPNQLNNSAFPSPPSTSTSSQPNVPTNLIVTGRSQPPQSKSANVKSTVQTPNNTAANRPSSGIFNFLFRGRKSDSQNFQNFINEGSITANAWTMMNKQASTKVRLRALETLTTISQQRKLQVSTLEGIWTETKDMLDNPMCRQAFLNCIYNITVSQIKEIGLALRLTFFETIRSIGLSDITVRWLTALSDYGRIVEPFEISIAELLADWLEKVVLKSDESNAGLAPEVIQLCANLICHQNAFVDEESMSRIIRCCCKRIVRGPGDQLSSCLTLLEAIFEHSVIAKSELFLLISTLCFIVCLDVEADKTWKLFSILLTSDHSYAVLAHLQSIMRTFVPKASEDRQEVAVQIARGAVFALAQALWGTKRIDSLNCSPCVVLTAFEESMFTDVLVARQVMHAIRRLVVKHGKTLQLFNWAAVIKLLRSAVHLCGEDVETAVIIKHDLHSIISLVESLIDRKEYTGSREEFYVVLEECVIDRPDCSALNLLDYRIAQLTPEMPDWIDKVHSLLNKFLYEGVSLIRREKSVYVMHNFYKKWRILYEPEILRKIVLPICTNMVPNEREVSIQYYLICVLFDAAKVAKINIEDSNEIYMSILNAIGSVFNGGISLDNDNLEVSACLLAELLDERFAVLTFDMVEIIFNLIIRHLELHYIKNGSTSGCEVRMRLFETLLLIQSHPLNGQLARVLILTPTQFKPIYNPQIIRAGVDTKGQFSWTAICEITTLGLQTETHWPTLERILEFLSGTIEHRFLVYTAGEYNVNKLVNAVLGVVSRVEERYPLLPKAKLARYLCPVLGKLVNYTPTHDNQICKIIVYLVRSGCPQAIMAADAAIQVLPEKMALFNRSLLENLATLKPMAQLAIPIIELLGDSSEIPQFHGFFTEKHYKIVINLLAPYSNARQFNAFIVTSVYQTAMRWFLCVPMSIRGPIAVQMFGSFARMNNLFPLQKPPRASKSPEADTSEKSMVNVATTLMATDTLFDVDSHPTALIITPSKKRSNIKKQANNLQEQNSLESEINAATTIGEFFLQNLSDSPKGLEKRNASGDGRQPIYELPFEDPTPLFSTGDTISLETDFIGDFKGVNELAQQILSQEYAIQQQQDLRQSNKTRESFAANLTIELLENLSYYIRFFRTKTVESLSAFPSLSQQIPGEINEDLVEKLVENWVVDGTILTLRVLVKPEPVIFGLHSRRIATISVDRLDTNEAGTKAGKAANAIRSISRDKKRTNTTSNLTTSKQRNASVTSKESDDLLRRRHQSTKASTSSSVSPQKVCRNVKELSQPPEEINQFSGRATPNSDSDDVFMNQDTSEDKSPEWIQLVIRHVFGKESYVMRSFTDIPLDFDNALGCANNSDPTSLLLHLRGNHSAVHLKACDNDLIARSLQFLDTMPNEEIHEVSVIYLREDNHASMNDVLLTEYGSERFASFVRRLGKPCKTKEESANICYEHVDFLQKIRFHVATLTPCSNEAECQEKRRLIENSTICVVFNESGTPCKLSQLFRKSDQVALEVTPQDNSTVTINMHARKEIACWIAMSRVLLPDSQAAHVLRKMIVRAQRSWRCWTSMTNEESAEQLPYLGCTVERQRHVHKLRKRGIVEPF